MKRTLLFIFLVLAVLARAEDEPAGRKYAVLVGVQKYEGSGLGNLKYCENDVGGLADVLRGTGLDYHVILLTKTEAQKNLDRDDTLPTAENIQAHLKYVLTDRRPQDTVLLAFAGHGVQLKKDGKMYFCPSKCNLDKLETLISIDDLYEMLKDCKAGSKIVLIDACRNDPLDGRSGGDERLSSVTRPLLSDPPGGTAVMFSCSKGQTARESDSRNHGYLFHFLIEGMRGDPHAINERTGEISWLKLAGYVADEVRDAVHDDYGPQVSQTPEIKGNAINLTLGKSPTSAVSEIGALGDRYFNGTLKSDEVEPAYRQFLKAAISGRGNAQAWVALMYLSGQGVKKDYAEALHWAREAAKQKIALGQHLLGYIFEKGCGVEKDSTEAIHWYREAADQNWPDSQLNLGLIFKDTDEPKANTWFTKAIQIYHVSAENEKAASQANLALIYANGYGVVTDYVQAARWGQKSAELGNANGQSLLGALYQTGNGVSKDDMEAIKWYRKSAGKGNSDGERSLGNMYYYGHGVEKDYVEAVRWYRKSAEHGDESGQHNLGVCYENGEGVRKDVEEAVRWYRKSAARGYQLAKDELARLERE